MSEVKIVEKNSDTEFIKEVNELLKEGYKISSSSCGYVPEPYDCSFYMAILIKEEL